MRSASHAVSWLMDVLALLQLAIVFIAVSVPLQLLIAAKEWPQSVTSAIALILGFSAVWGVSALITGTRNTLLIASLFSNGTVTGTGLLISMHGRVPWPPRAQTHTIRREMGWNVLYTVAVLLVVLSWNS